MKYISVYAKKTGKRITSFVIGVHGNNIQEVKEVAEKQYPNEYLVKQNETAWQYALKHELIYSGKELVEPPKKTEEDIKEEKLDSLDAEYTRKIKDIEAEIVRTLAIGDDDLLSELKEEREQLVNEYKEKRGELTND